LQALVISAKQLLRLLMPKWSLLVLLIGGHRLVVMLLLRLGMETPLPLKDKILLLLVMVLHLCFGMRVGRLILAVKLLLLLGMRLELKVLLYM